MKIYKKWSISIISLTLSLILIFMTVNFIVDPLQYYRKAFYQPDFSDQQRYQNPGLAKNYQYDTIILGTSMSENFLPSYIDAKLGVKTLKLSIMGSSAKEQFMIGNLAVNTGKVKNIIWAVDYFSLRGEPNRVRDEYGAFPYYLYDKNLFNDVNYLLNIDTTRQVFRLLAVALGVMERKNPDLNILNNWGFRESFGKEKVLKEWERLKKGGPVTITEYEIDNIKKNVDQNIIPLVKSNPEITFYLYYPPYSILQHRFYYEKNPQLFENELFIKKYIFKQIGGLPNVKIYDFQHEKKITFNLDNYKDLAHHSPAINEWIIDNIVKDKYRVNNNNLEQYNRILKEQVESLDVSKF
ncbi:hypothetical protein Tfer_3133 [Thermincola ferriacetica]|uniref:Uncharacterized protein n=1 Tax=Thermincola ferriacetica TaxID=281456 RepID=A0A0L6VY99_9FIRM|nr:hypothetical protein [Thermincola ferriacetica]KNZ68307.1 hypothetical protein Tfer_3133 [Thermincola ferriacetica]